MSVGPLSDNVSLSQRGWTMNHYRQYVFEQFRTLIYRFYSFRTYFVPSPAWTFELRGSNYSSTGIIGSFFHIPSHSIICMYTVFYCSSLFEQACPFYEIIHFCVFARSFKIRANSATVDEFYAIVLFCHYWVINKETNISYRTTSQAFQGKYKYLHSMNHSLRWFGLSSPIPEFSRAIRAPGLSETFSSGRIA